MYGATGPFGPWPTAGDVSILFRLLLVSFIHVFLESVPFLLRMRNAELLESENTHFFLRKSCLL